MELGVSIIL